MDYGKISMGVFSLLASIGSKYIHLEYNKEIEDILRSQVMRMIIVFSIIYTNINSVTYSIAISLIYFIVTSWFVINVEGEEKVKKYYEI